VVEVAAAGQTRTAELPGAVVGALAGVVAVPALAIAGGRAGLTVAAAAAGATVGAVAAVLWAAIAHLALGTVLDACRATGRAKADWLSGATLLLTFLGLLAGVRYGLRAQAVGFTRSDELLALGGLGGLIVGGMIGGLVGRQVRTPAAPGDR
jgi:hypothetical protein